MNACKLIAVNGIASMINVHREKKKKKKNHHVCLLFSSLIFHNILCVMISVALIIGVAVGVGIVVLFIVIIICCIACKKSARPKPEHNQPTAHASAPPFAPGHNESGAHVNPSFEPPPSYGDATKVHV